jgi:spermidine synthase
LLLATVLVWKSRGYEAQFEQRVVMSDHTATLIATGEGMQKKLIVNGVGITLLTPITKMMAHLPLAYLGHAPKNALVVCFGMGTTYRSLLSWNIPATAVELVPNVPKLFSYYHSDGQQLLNSPRSHVVIDDGRRYLERTSEQYDVITIDPPPPMEAAGSSMLFSKEFYAIVNKRLSDGGIFQQWLISLDPLTQSAATRALMESFPYVRVFKSVEGWGLHFLASNRPIPNLTPQQLVQHMPESALTDMMEWGPEKNAVAEFAVVLNSEFLPGLLMKNAPDAPALQDDRPVNEYYLLRRHVF